MSIVLLPLAAITTILYGALRSAGDVTAPMAYSIATSVVVLAPASLLFAETLGGGVAGAFWALALAEAVKAVLLGWRWWRGRWAELPRVVDDADGAASDTTAGA